MSICRDGEYIFLLGPIGTGITHHACGVILKVSNYLFYQLFNTLKDANLKNKLTQTMKQLSKVDILSIYNFAFKNIDQISAELLFAMVDSRYRQNPIIITIKMTIPNWLDLFSDHPVIAKVILHHLAHSAHQIVMKVTSYRKKFRM